MARTFEDMVLMHNVIAGPGDYSANVIDAGDLPLKFEPIKGMKIAYVGGMGIFEPSKETQKAIDQAIEVLEAQGATVDRVKLDIGMTPETLSEQFSNVALAGAMGGMFTDYADKADQMTPYANYFVNKASKGGYGNKQLFEAEVNTKKIYKAIVDNVFAKGYDVMIMPTMPTSHTPADHDFTKDKVVEDGVEYPMLVNGLYTVPFNLLNWMPVISVPVGLTSQDMPVGMQIVGRTSDPDAPFRVANAYSRAGIKLYQGDQMPATR
jgi:amidase